MRLLLKILTITIFLLGLLTPVVNAAVADVYLVYAGKNRKLKTEVFEELSGTFSVKTYNVGLLGLADYSGVQKVVSKISKAKIVMMLHDAASEAFKGSTIKTDLILFNSVNTTLKSQKKIFYIIDTKTDISKIGKELKTSVISSVADLTNTDADVLIIDENIIKISEIVKTLLNEQLRRVK